MICPNCKADISEKSKFCIYCGTKIEKAQDEITKKRFNKKTVIITVAAGLVLMILVACWWLISSKESLLIEALEQKINAEKVIEYVEADSNVPMSLQYKNAVASSVEFTVKEIEYFNNQAVVSFSYTDIMSLAEDYGDSDHGPDAFYQYCIRKIEDGEAKKTEEIRLSFVMEKVDGDKICIIENTPELTNVLTGGIYKELLDLLEEFE